jgi:hypothetical protein
MNNKLVQLLLGIILLAAGPAGAADKLTLRINNQSIFLWRTADLEEAKKAAAAAHKPIAWIASATKLLDGRGTISAESARGATLHALYAYRDQTVLVFEDAYEENHKVLPLVDDALHTPDPHYNPPKVIFLNPDATEVLAKVEYEADFVKRAQGLAAGLKQAKAKLNPPEAKPDTQK